MINKETSNHNAELIRVSLSLKFSQGAFGLGFSQHQCYWNFGPSNSLLWEPILCTYALQNVKSIPDLYPLDVGTNSPPPTNPHPSVDNQDNQKCLQTLSNVPGGQNCPWLRNTVLHNTIKNIYFRIILGLRKVANPLPIFP